CGTLDNSQRQRAPPVASCSPQLQPRAAPAAGGLPRTVPGSPPGGREWDGHTPGDRGGLMGRVQEIAGEMIAHGERAVGGKRAELRYLLVALLANRHVLLEAVPGVGKTAMVRALARSIDCTFRRIQFTPDLLPSDIVGLSVYDPATQRFTFRPGPIHSQVVLADEINRTSPKTQSALLEAMEEGQVTVDGQTYPLPR